MLVDIYIDNGGNVLRVAPEGGLRYLGGELAPAAMLAAYAGRVVIALAGDGSIRGGHIERGSVRIDGDGLLDGAVDFAEALSADEIGAILGRPVEFVHAPAPVTADHVRAEAQRRMMLATGARDPAHLAIVIQNNTREQVRLLRSPAMTAEEAARAAELGALDDRIEAIRAASNALEPSPPADYRDDRHWPALG